jgi:type II secretory pathway pseudopilin PulG
MNSVAKNNGFSLTEVLMAVGILSVGLMLVATMFPVGIYLTSVASERTMAAIVADEAFAKIRLYGLDLNSGNWMSPRDKECMWYEEVSLIAIDPNEFSYPPVDPCSTDNSQYYWSALCKKCNNDGSDTRYLITVFVARKTSPNHTYLNGGDGGKIPRAAGISDLSQPASNELNIAYGNVRYVNPPTTILDNASGRLYRVIERKVSPSTVVVLDRDWDSDTDIPRQIWVVPPPNTGGKNADVGVFQRIIRF